MEITPQAALAEQYIQNTNTSLFLTGKAGTGKTTFLHHIVSTVNKTCVVVAPTGVAAINAGGVTIHSFFQLPLCPFLPDVPELVTEYQMPTYQRKLRKEKIKMLRSLDLLIIDEISMVRADLLDAIDDTLRRYRHSSRPFGGVQLLMIGDIQQLPPVVTDREKPYIDRVYASPFFFESKALRRLNYITIQLTTIFRQQDPTFVNLLNKIRDNQFDIPTLTALNQRYQPNFDPDDKEHYIRLTTHNHQADSVNQRKLEALKHKSYTFKATIEGNFPDSSLPTDKELVLKEGAQVMFLKNDSSLSHAFYNGKIGTITAISNEEIIVTDEDGKEITVGQMEWENIKYETDSDNKQIKQVVDGVFRQYPLRLAWAITIHKAQGLTFDRVIIDAASSFTYGQVYVALSRCRTLEGLVLGSQISAHCAFDNSSILAFTSTFPTQEQVQEALGMSKIQYRYQILMEMFDFGNIQQIVERINRLYQTSLRSTYPKQTERVEECCNKTMPDLTTISERFRRQIYEILQQGNEERLAERVSKGAEYFYTALKEIASTIKQAIEVEVTNKETASDMANAEELFRDATEIRLRVLRSTVDKGFNIEDYLKVRSDYYLDAEEEKKKPKKKETANTYADVAHPKLAVMLTSWRREKYMEEDVPAYCILSQSALLGIADALPKNKKDLLAISGMGKVKVQKYGTDILEVIGNYCLEEGLPFQPAVEQTSLDTDSEEIDLGEERKEKKANKEKIATQDITLALLQTGKSIEEIAKAREMQVNTIEGHLLTAMQKGKLYLGDVLPADESHEIIDYLKTEQPESLKDAYNYFEGKYSYGKLRMVKWYLTTEE